MSAEAKNDPSQTPAMRQYHRFKSEHPDCVLFFRMGDFYEMFFDDAKLAHKVLGVTLTQRTAGVPMAGVPYHSVENYLRRMIQAGHRVAVCDQVEDPAQAKGLVDRDVTRIITPGTLTDESLLEEGAENPLAAVVLVEGEPKSGAVGKGSIRVGDDAAHRGTTSGGASGGGGFRGGYVAWVELSTGAFAVAHFEAGELVDELARIRPRELLYPAGDGLDVPAEIKRLAAAVGGVPTARPGWQFRQQEAIEALHRQFGVQSMAGFGFEDHEPQLAAAGAVVQYLLETQRAGDGSERGRIAHLRPPRRFERQDYLVIDQTSLRSLEVEQTMRSGGTEGSLLGVLQDCVTAMGKRALRQWLCYPLCRREAIEARQRVVGAMVEDGRFRDELRGMLESVQDVERIGSRIAVGRATPRDLVALGRSAQQAVALAKLLAQRPAVKPYYDLLIELCVGLAELGQAIVSACVEAPPQHMREGGLIRDGVDAQLDELRGLQRDSHAWLAQYQKQLSEETRIPSLKVGFNQVFGYYIELTAAHREKAPPQWSRKQTLKNAERFVTPELKEFEAKVLSAQSRAVAREQALCAELCAKAQGRLGELARYAAVVAELDVLAGFAKRAAKHRYVRPMMVDDPVLRIRGGRHPVLDEILGDRFVPNDVDLGAGGEADLPDASYPPAPPEEPGAKAHSTLRDAVWHPTGELPGAIPGAGKTLALITGPNMAGKSTYIRQTALIALLAHTGSYVPADQAVVGMVDRIFTRIGASDELHAGQSTFMVEMTETANICHHATEKSLVILDEIGRGTSTLDGLSLAWAIAEFLCARRCRTLFATHYHELTTLAEQYSNAGNLNVTVREWQDQIVFLHRIVPGSTDRSYGIHVAKIAGLPEAVVARAHELLGQLTVSHEGAVPAGGNVASGAGNLDQTLEGQFSLFSTSQDHPVLQELANLDLTGLTPMQAFDLIRQWRSRTDVL
ncbi:MAG: DNA mismatch repair protein MutS [Phycisphaeraceae bacterium]|nr:DNA mismatch repair protein MutS [Phycisphaeraceae bacterium]